MVGIPGVFRIFLAVILEMTAVLGSTAIAGNGQIGMVVAAGVVMAPWLHMFDMAVACG